MHHLAKVEVSDDVRVRRQTPQLAEQHHRNDDKLHICARELRACKDGEIRAGLAYTSTFIRYLKE